MVCLLVCVQNGSFSGETEIYASLDFMHDIVKVIRGFPASPDDTRVIELGEFEAKSTLGGVRICFSCANGKGDPLIRVFIRNGNLEHALLVISGVEPNDIDLFVKELEGLRISDGNNATLFYTT